MLGKFLLFGFFLLSSCNGLSFEKEATTLLTSQGIDLSDMAAESTTGERKDAIKDALKVVRGQLVQQVSDIKTDYNKREASRLLIRNQKLGEASKAKVAYETALAAYKTVQGLSDQADATYKSEKEDDEEETDRLISNIDALTGILTTVLNGDRSVTWLPADWSLGTERSKAVMDQTSGPQQAFCGLSRRDVFKLRRCEPISKGIFVKASSDQKEVKLPLTESKGDWTRECPDNQYIGSISSTYSDDRRWIFGCKSFKQLASKECAWSGSYTDSFDFTCAGSKVLAGVKRDYYTRTFFFKKTIHRRYAFKCCEVVTQ